jgi:AraC family transcriptional regulator
MGDGRLSALQTFTTERNFHFEQGSFEVRSYVWDHATTDTWTFDAHFIDFPITPRPKPAWGEYLNGPRATGGELGRIMFVPAGRTLRSGAAVGRQRSLSCALATGMIDGLLQRSPVWDEAALAKGLRLNGPKIEWLLFEIYRELQEPGFATHVVMESLANALAVALIRDFALDRHMFETRCAGGLAPWRMRRIRERVHADAPAPSLDELAKLCDMSVRHLTRAFKAEAGQTIATFVHQAMMEKACELLARGDVSIADVARKLGFSTATSFAYAFRRSTGQRPSDVRGQRQARSA